MAIWPSTGKEQFSWLSACAVSLYAALIVCVHSSLVSEAGRGI